MVVRPYTIAGRPAGSARLAPVTGETCASDERIRVSLPVPMSASTRAAAGPSRDGRLALPLTGERTIPGLDEENYWFRRHEVVYQRLADRCAGRDVLEAGFGEGYGADLLADVARRVIGLDYDESAVAHVRARYPRVEMRQGNLAELPLRRRVGRRRGQLPGHRAPVGSVTVRRASAAACCGPAALLLMSTPNRITFSPGRDTPINPFHTRELNAAELTELLVDAGFRVRVDARGLPRRRGCASSTPSTAARSSTRRSPARWPTRRGPPTCWPTSPASRTDDFDLLDADRRATSTTAWIWWRSRCAREPISAASRRSRACSPSSCTPTCRGWPTTAAGRSARNGSTSPGRRPTCR